ncbi:MAG: hypothetical protein IPL88_00095 [Rhizobiales bacterium]|nr:hypothetical protein [Hyphomicrobiales bacterium]
MSEFRQETPVEKTPVARTPDQAGQGLRAGLIYVLGAGLALAAAVGALMLAAG